MKIGGNYIIDFAKVSNVPRFVVNVKAGDIKRKISLTLLENNTAINLDNYTVTIACKKNDGNNILNNVIIIDSINGICEVEVTEQMLALDTDLPCEIVLYGKDGTISSSSNFVISSIPSVRNENDIVSTSEFTALSKALSEVKSIDYRFNQKADKTEVFTMANMGQDIREAMTGGSVAVVGKNSILNDNIIDKQISYNKTDFIITGKNLFNKETVSERGWFINQTNGNPQSNEYTTEMHYSDFIKVVPSSKITITGQTHSYCFFDINKKYITGDAVRSDLFTLDVPSNAEYFTFNPYYYSIDRAQVEYGESATEYEPHGLDIPAFKISKEMSNVKEELKKIDQNKAILDALTSYKEISIDVGNETTERSAYSTFTGWAVPIKKSELKDKITYVSVYATAYDNSTDKNKITDVPVNLELIKCNDDITSNWGWKVLKVLSKGVLKESGKIEFEIDLPLEDLDDVFYLGVRATTQCNFMFWEGKRNYEYSFGEYRALYSISSSASIDSYTLSTSTQYIETHFKVGTGISARISEHTHKVEDIEGIEDLALANKVKLSLPNKYELVVGDTFELFYKGILLCNNPYNYNINISCSKGAYYSKKYMFTPSASDVGTHNMTISVYNDNQQLLDSKTIKLIVKNKASNPSSIKNVLCIGDSLTAGGVWPSEAYRRLTGTGGTPVAEGLSNIKFIGSKKGSNGAYYEGYGGWTYDHYNGNSTYLQNYWINTSSDKGISYQKSVWQDSNGVQWVLETIESNRIKIYRKVYGGQLPPTSGTLTWVSGGDGSDNSNITYTSYVAESGNPFWNDNISSVDFKNYATKLGVTSIDHCYVLLGWNQTTNTESVFKTGIRTFVNNLRSSFPNCKVTLLGLQVPSLDGFGSNYGCSWNFYDKLKVVFNMNKWNYEVSQEYDNMDFINIAGQFDTENNMPTATRLVNVRSSKTEIYGSNGVHPANEGYLQIADAVYRHLSHNI